MTSNEVKDVATIVGVIIGAGSLAVSAFNSWLNAKTNRAKFWLELRSAFSKHDEIHRKLHPRGDWFGGTREPTAEEQYQVEAYMGLFEHCEVMLEQKLIDEQTFREIYAYRLRNIVSNEWILTQKLKAFPREWRRFIALLKRMNVPLG